LNLILDENLPRAFARSLEALGKADGHSVAHVRDFVDPKTDDVEWIPLISSQGDWVAISGDRRMITRRHELRVLQDSKLTTFILAAGWSRLVFWEKAWLLVRWWPMIIEIAGKHPAGTIFVVPHKHSPSDLKSHA
jgi:hypothetical protein